MYIRDKGSENSHFGFFTIIDNLITIYYSGI